MELHKSYFRAASALIITFGLQAGKAEAEEKCKQSPFQSGMASWYGPGFDGNDTANGEVFDEDGISAAHKTLPFGSRVRVINEGNGREIYLRINDRGPYKYGRIIDLSKGAAARLNMIDDGVAPVKIYVCPS